MAKFEVICTMIYNGSIVVDAENENDATKKVNDMLYNDSRNDFPTDGVVAGINFSFGEVTTDFANEQPNEF